MAKPSMKLATYRAKRDFDLTTEPSGARAAAHGHRYVIQQHAARRMHYDFRLELDGVLLSWAVPKGPSLAPNQRRLAARTEDHPLDYHDFEGIIPAGEYGGGAVSVWDRGSWAPDGGDEAARRGLVAGKLTFELHGEKLHGRWHDHIAVNDQPSLVALAQLGTLEVHTWGTHVDHVERPDMMVFDLDPDLGVAWERVALAAIELRGLLHEHDLESFVKTTGGKGLHVCVPVERELDWHDFKAFTKAVSEELERRQPTAFTTRIAKTHRKGRIFIDYLRNGRGATFVAPYSPRARPGAPIATPITWQELAAGVTPDRFTIKTLPARLEQPDPWATYATTTQRVGRGRRAR
ncbi:MAG: non-homologous end-joining DNA ligase [Kofleriaceae bacterium]